MKRIYKIIGLIILFIILFVIINFNLFPFNIITPMNQPINCTEWYKTNTGFCDDFSDPLINSLLNILLPIICVLAIIIYFFIPSKSESNEKI